MKKILLFAAAAAVVLTSCSKNEVTTSMGDNTPIGFGAYAGVSAKGTITTLTADFSMGVFASYTDEDTWGGSTETPNFMYDQLVSTTDGGGSWTYSPIKYWPAETDDKISFFAYAPQGTDADIVWTAAAYMTGNPSGDFTLNVDAPEDMVDFVAGNAIDQTKGATSNATVVNFTLKHKLSRLKFLVKADENIEEHSTIVIKSITLSDDANGSLYESATYTFSGDTDRGAWSNQGTAATTIDLDGDLLVETTSISLGAGTAQYVENGVALSGDQTNATDLFADGEYLFLLPIDGTTGGDASSIKATVVYDIVTKDADLANGSYSAIKNTQTASLPGATFLAQGKAYAVTLTIGIDKVVLDAEVDTTDWGSEDEEAKDQPTDGDGTSNL